MDRQGGSSRPKRPREEEALDAPREKRYKFRTFIQRIADVDIDVHHKLHALELEQQRSAASDRETPFTLQTLDKWRELNLTAQFVVFAREVQPLIRSLPLVLRNRDALAELISRHLRSGSANALAPILEIVSALAVDLRSEFYPSPFEPLVRTLAELLDPADTDALELTFQTLCYLFK
ncbi:hypothetical protein T492DRAFT_593164, partial [Pavlovales sp. CCMP2436]